MIQSAMDYPKLNLSDLLPPWERELPNSSHETIFESLLRGDVDFSEPSPGENIVRNTRPLAQDVIGAIFIRQGYAK